MFFTTFIEAQVKKCVHFKCLVKSTSVINNNVEVFCSIVLAFVERTHIFQIAFYTSVCQLLSSISKQ